MCLAGVFHAPDRRPSCAQQVILAATSKKGQAEACPVSHPCARAFSPPGRTAFAHLQPRLATAVHAERLLTAEAHHGCRHALRRVLRHDLGARTVVHEDAHECLQNGDLPLGMLQQSQVHDELSGTGSPMPAIASNSTGFAGLITAM